MKRYVKVSVIFNTDGTMIPKTIIWDKQRSYPIDAITDIRVLDDSPDNCGLKYTCLIWGKRKVLCYSNNRWYVVA